MAPSKSHFALPSTGSASDFIRRKKKWQDDGHNNDGSGSDSDQESENEPDRTSERKKTGKKKQSHHANNAPGGGHNRTEGRLKGRHGAAAKSSPKVLPAAGAGTNMGGTVRGVHEMTFNLDNDEWSEKKVRHRQTFGVPLSFVMEQQRATHPTLGIPCIVDQCVRSVTKNGIDTENLVVRTGAEHSSGFEELVHRVDSNSTSDLLGDSADPADIVGVLFLFLRLLPEPLLTFALFDDWIVCASQTDHDARMRQCKMLLRKLPRANLETLHAICEFALKVTHNAHVNLITPMIMSSVLAPLLLWPPEPVDSIEYMMLTANFRTLIEDMVKHVDEFFSDLLDQDGQEIMLQAKLFGHSRGLYGIVALPELQEVWSICGEGKIVIWDVEEHQQVHSIHTGLEKTNFISALMEDTVVATGSSWGVRTYSSRTRHLLQELQGHAWCITQVVDSIWIGGEGEIAVWAASTSSEDLPHDQPLHTEEQESRSERYKLANMTVSAKDAASHSIRHAIHRSAPIVKAKTLAVNRQDVVFSLCFIRSQAEVWAAVSPSGSMRVYDAATLTPKQVIEGHSRAPVILLQCDDIIWSVGDALTLWSVKTRDCLRKLEGHGEPIASICYAEPYIWTGARDSGCILWSVKDAEIQERVKDCFTDTCRSICALENRSTGGFEVWVASSDKSIGVFRQYSEMHPRRKQASGRRIGFGLSQD